MALGWQGVDAEHDAVPFASARRTAVANTSGPPSIDTDDVKQPAAAQRTFGTRALAAPAASPERSPEAGGCRVDQARVAEFASVVACLEGVGEGSGWRPSFMAGVRRIAFHVGCLTKGARDNK